MKGYARFHMIAIILVLVGGFNWLLIGMKYPDLVKMTLPSSFVNPVYIIVGLATLYLLFRRDTYLPFLGYTVVPSNAFQNMVPKDSDTKVTVPVEKDASKVLYWATMSGDVVSSPEEGYKGTKNVGVAEVFGDTVELNFVCPKQYKVWGKTLDRHVHYRFIMDNGILTPVNTVKVDCK
jgi:uncharacterized membrane protein YuzA (DUF378 family)